MKTLQVKKQVEKEKKELEKLKPVIDVICNGKELESKYRDLDSRYNR